MLRAEVEPAGLRREVARAAAADGGAAAVRVALWLVAGAAVWLGLAEWRRRRDGIPRRDALLREAAVFAPLLLRPAITLLALVSVAVRASYPYGFTLPVALTQDWGDRRRTPRRSPRSSRCACRPSAFPAPRAGRGVPPELPRLRRARARLGLALGGAPRQRAEVPAPGGGPRPRAHASTPRA